MMVPHRDRVQAGSARRAGLRENRSGTVPVVFDVEGRAERDADAHQHLTVRSLAPAAGSLRQLPVGTDEMAGVAVGIALQIVLMLGLGLPEGAGRLHFGHDRSGPP